MTEHMHEELRDSEESWPVVATEDLHRDGWVMALRRDSVQRPGSDETFSRLVLEHPGAAVVLAVCLAQMFNHTAYHFGFLRGSCVPLAPWNECRAFKQAHDPSPAGFLQTKLRTDGEVPAR